MFIHIFIHVYMKALFHFFLLLASFLVVLGGIPPCYPRATLAVIKPFSHLSMPWVQNFCDFSVSSESNVFKRLLRSLLSSLKHRQSDKRKVLILMCDTGGGHRATANALSESMTTQFPGRLEVDIMDLWTDHANAPFNLLVPAYRLFAKRPLLWRFFYSYGLFPPTKKFTEEWSRFSCYNRFRDAINATKPDVVVSVHPLCQLHPLSVVGELNKERPVHLPPIPFITVVTDLGSAHSTWFDKRVDYCIVPSEAIRDLAIGAGIPRSKVVLRGLPVRSSFDLPQCPKNLIRPKLGLKKDLRTVLVMGGGDGVGGLHRIAQDVVNGLAKLSMPSQAAVIFGNNNASLQLFLSQLKWPENVNVVVKGFVDNVHEYMSAADCLVTKAGPGTIAEAITRRLPLVLSSFLPGQVKNYRSHLISICFCFLCYCFYLLLFAVVAGGW